MADNKRLVELALLGLRAERERIDQEINELKKSLGSGRSSRKLTVTGARRPMTDAQKKAISQTMKKYWSKRKKQKASASR